MLSPKGVRAQISEKSLLHILLVQHQPKISKSEQFLFQYIFKRDTLINCSNAYCMPPGQGMFPSPISCKATDSDECATFSLQVIELEKNKAFL